MLACENGFSDIARLILDSKTKTGSVNLEGRDADLGKTPLLWATESGHHGVARMLVLAGKASLLWNTENVLFFSATLLCTCTSAFLPWTSNCPCQHRSWGRYFLFNHLITLLIAEVSLDYILVYTNGNSCNFLFFLPFPGQSLDKFQFNAKLNELLP